MLYVVICIVECSNVSTSGGLLQGIQIDKVFILVAFIALFTFSQIFNVRQYIRPTGIRQQLLLAISKSANWVWGTFCCIAILSMYRKQRQSEQYVSFCLFGLMSMRVNTMSCSGSVCENKIRTSKRDISWYQPSTADIKGKQQAAEF